MRLPTIRPWQILGFLLLFGSTLWKWFAHTIDALDHLAAFLHLTKSDHAVRMLLSHLQSILSNNANEYAPFVLMLCGAGLLFTPYLGPVVDRILGRRRLVKEIDDIKGWSVSIKTPCVHTVSRFSGRTSWIVQGFTFINLSVSRTRMLQISLIVDFLNLNVPPMYFSTKDGSVSQYQKEMQARAGGGEYVDEHLGPFIKFPIILAPQSIIEGMISFDVMQTDEEAAQYDFVRSWKKVTFVFMELTAGKSRTLEENQNLDAAINRVTPIHANPQKNISLLGWIWNLTKGGS